MQQADKPEADHFANAYSSRIVDGTDASASLTDQFNMKLPILITAVNNRNKAAELALSFGIYLWLCGLCEH